MCRTICFSRDSLSLFAFLSTPADEKERVRFYELSIGREPVAVRGTSRALTGICLSDKAQLVTRNEGPALTVWDLSRRQQTKVVRVANEKLYDIALSPAGGVLAIAGDEDQAKFLDVSDWQLLPTKFPFIHKGIDFIGMDTVGDIVITASDDGRLKAWKSPEFIRKLGNAYYPKSFAAEFPHAQY